jgi:hypothetical protein
MDDVIKFVTKYALFIFIVGVITIVLMNSRISNLPSPFLLAPGEATRRFYTPLRIFRFIRTVGVIITLVGAFYFARNISALNKSQTVDTDNLTKSIAESLSGLINTDQGNDYKSINNSTTPQRPIIGGGGGGGIAKSNQQKRKSEIVQVKREMTNAGLDYLFVDENQKQIIGIHNILKHFTDRGYFITNTIKNTTDEIDAIEIIMEVPK